MSGNIRMGGVGKITSLVNPTNNQDATTKSYFDSNDALHLDLTGGSLTGNLTMSDATEVIQATAPSTAHSLCNKTYVDIKLSLAGGTPTGDLFISKDGTASVGRTGIARPATSNVATVLQLGNNVNSFVSSYIGSSASVSELGIYSPSKAIVYGNLDGDTADTPYQVMKSEILAGANNAPIGKVTVNKDLDCIGCNMAVNLVCKVGTDSERTLGCDDIASRSTALDPSRKFFHLVLGNTNNSIMSSCALDSGMTIPSIQPVRIGSYNSATKIITKTMSFSGSGHTSYMPLDISTNKITGLGAPTHSDDAATKSYVDSSFKRCTKRSRGL